MAWMKGNRGFTLVELLTVVVIIGILATLSLPRYEKMIWRARWSQAYLVMNAIRTAEVYHYHQHGVFANGIFSKAYPKDYADTPEKLRAWLRENGIEVVEFSEKAFEHFSYDVRVDPAGGWQHVFALKKDSPHWPDPEETTYYGIRIDIPTGDTIINPDPRYYP